MKSFIFFTLIFYYFIICEADTFECGKRKAAKGRIIGAWEKAEKGAWPWMVALYDKTDNEFKSTGNLITDKLVIVAANEFHFKYNEAFPPENVEAILGKYNLNVTDESGTEKRDVLDIIYHPDWNVTSDRFNGDLAIAVLKERVKFTANIIPICLPSARHSEPKEPGTIVSWGQNVPHKEGFTTQDVPYQMDFQVYNGTYCLLTFNELARFGWLSTFCAGFNNESRGVCYGDLGSGFYHQNKDTKAYELTGITSKNLDLTKDGTTECDVNKFSIYTNINWFMDWIQGIMKKYEKDEN